MNNNIVRFENPPLYSSFLAVSLFCSCLVNFKTICVIFFSGKAKVKEAREEEITPPTDLKSEVASVVNDPSTFPQEEESTSPKQNPLLISLQELGDSLADLDLDDSGTLSEEKNVADSGILLNIGNNFELPSKISSSSDSDRIAVFRFEFYSKV